MEDLKTYLKRFAKPQVILGVGFLAAGLYSIFNGADLIPDTVIPVVGYLDDALFLTAGAGLIVYYLFGKQVK